MIYMRIEIKVTVNTTPKSLKKGEGDRSLSRKGMVLLLSFPINRRVPKSMNFVFPPSYEESVSTKPLCYTIDIADNLT